MAPDPKPEEKKQELQTIDTSQIVSQVTDTVSKQIDSKLEEVTSKLAEDVTTKTTEAITEKIAGKPKDEYTPKSWEQVRKDAAADALKTVEEREAEKAKREKEEADVKAKSEAERQQEQNQLWDQQLARLVEDEIIPDLDKDIREKLKKREALGKEEMEDPGFRARVELFRLAKEHPDALNNLELVARKHYQPEDYQPGADAPVFGAGSAAPSTKSDSYSYEDIHNTPLGELIGNKD